MNKHVYYDDKVYEVLQETKSEYCISYNVVKSVWVNKKDCIKLSPPSIDCVIIDGKKHKVVGDLGGECCVIFTTKHYTKYGNIEISENQKWYEKENLIPQINGENKSIMTTLNDRMIREWAQQNVVPFEPNNVNPASIDLRWSGKYKIAIKSHWLYKVEKWLCNNINRLFNLDAEPFVFNKLKGHWSEVKSANNIDLTPGKFYLLDTLEYLKMPENAVGELFLKSSSGRKGIEHLHAGFVDPSFEGTLTLEIEMRAPWAETIEKGQRLIQLKLESMAELPEKSYKVTGHYNGQNTPTEAK